MTPSKILETSLSRAKILISASVSLIFPEQIMITVSNGTPLQYSCLENPMDREAW